MPVKYLAPIPEVPKEFVEPNATDHFIYWLFRFRCVSCRKTATEINEIVPRSRSKKSISTWDNRVTMCKECHGEYHRKGVNEVAVTELKQKRHGFLLSMGREEYINYVSLEEWGISPVENLGEILIMQKLTEDMCKAFSVPKELLD